MTNLNEILIRDIAPDTVLELDVPKYYIEANNAIDTRIEAIELISAAQTQTQYSIQKTSPGAVFETTATGGELRVVPPVNALAAEQELLPFFRVVMGGGI
ncbi:hypothetical protein Desor_2297 [Desulfosporosinus orientis DSM 765]|uniref:Uncharacterized protein n=1 Tax=Desulfosporosinus orientis (strain ATCC 19365 / DSM 765 / NCIMB 8382 / VKM B-1628 / Singapore I) TaxID=768706 RepID=G7WBB2_DESOD|nr:hypothetical protein [Desulfosporosinus orientis]AET67893.1 hypothetical protein Desor_2297 [Desulfosporosinus orientis DSM 765]